MKKVCALFLVFVLLLCTACSSAAPEMTEPTETTTEATPQATEAPKPGPEIVTQELKDRMEALVEKCDYQGIVHLAYKGEPLYQSVRGTNDMGEPLTVESSMFVGSVSKQFCAAAILILRDQGKLSLEDTLEKYFPEYTIGKDITLHHLLSMQSGIVRDPAPESEDMEQYFVNTAEENMAVIKEWTFKQPLLFAPGTQFAYSNVNYNLLSCVVEMVSGESYGDFLRKHIFEPAGMTRSGVIPEVEGNPQWGLNGEHLEIYGLVDSLAQGCGDVVSTAGDMDLWVDALQSGKLISMESYREMTTGHSASYGYGLMRGTHGGWGHNGALPGYNTRTYFNEEYGYTLFVATGKSTTYNGGLTDDLADALLKLLFEAVDAAE